MEHILVLDPQSTSYVEYFDFMVSRGTEKKNAIEKLAQLVQQLPARRLFVDAGAGLGTIVSVLKDEFSHAIAVEPAPFMADQIRAKCPELEIRRTTILEAGIPAAAADLVVCAHVFYYIDHNEWPLHLEKLVSWLAPQGVLVIFLAHPDTQCMKIYEDFHHLRVDIRTLAQTAQEMCGEEYEVLTEIIPAQYKTASFAEMYRIAEFMATPPPGPDVPTRRAMEEYVRQHFTCAEHGYCLSCDNVMIQIRRRVDGVSN